MELRSSRSRSRTPFIQLTRLEEENMANSIKQKTIEERRTYTTRQKTIESTSSSIVDDVFESPVKVKQRRSEGSTRVRQKTSDYSSEEEHTENGTFKTALEVYKEAGEYWNKYPKTDYTYSLHSKDRMEVAPGVIGMPNMSRKSLRRSMEPTPRYNAVHTTYSSNNVVRKTLNFDETKNTSVFRRLRTSIRSVTTRFYRTVATFLFVVYSAVETSMLWTARSYYRAVSRLFLFDTWLMQKTTAQAQSTKKYGALIAIMFLPLLLFAGWTLWSTITEITRESRVSEAKPLNLEETQDINAIISSPEFEQHLTNRLNRKYEGLTAELTAIKSRLTEIEAGFKLEAQKCCKRQVIYLPARSDVEVRLGALEASLKRELNARLEEVLSGATGTVTDAQIRKIVQDSLAVYDADKTGLVDYALESSGGQIISTRCTENYHSRTAVVSILGVPLWYPSNTPRVVITPGVVPGECWAFQNFPGFVVIQLSGMIRVSAFSVEHIPGSLAPGGARDSAPRGFSVWGLTAENDRDPWSFGVFEYRLEGPPLQYFAVGDPDAAPLFNIVELRVESNHGNMNYTCLYRFRVHGNQT